MRFRIWLGLVGALGAGMARAQIVDRIVAVVDREAITLSEAEQAAGLHLLGDGEGPERGAESVPLAEIVERLIEARLMQREVERFPGEPIPPDEIRQAVESIRRSFPSEEDFRRALAAEEMGEEELARLAERQIAITRYLERRFRVLIQVSEEEIRRYYERELLPELDRNGQARPPLDSVAETIRRILEEMEFNRRVEDWIDELKARATIRRYVW